MKSAADKLATGVMKLKQDNNKLSKEASELRDRNDELEKRARAEEVLLKAKGTPSKFNTSTVDEFLSKRAQLENSSYEELEKIATAIEFLDEDDGISIGDISDESEGGDIYSWLENLSHNNF